MIWVTAVDAALVRVFAARLSSMQAMPWGGVRGGTMREWWGLGVPMELGETVRDGREYGLVLRCKRVQSLFGA